MPKFASEHNYPKEYRVFSRCSFLFYSVRLVFDVRTTRAQAGQVHFRYNNGVIGTVSGPDIFGNQTMQIMPRRSYHYGDISRFLHRRVKARR